MKVAIFHNFLDNIGGAEKVALILARELYADVYTTNINADMIAKMGFNDINIISIGKIPTNAPLRQQSALKRFRRLNLKNKYDHYIIAGDWAVSGTVNHHPNTWYVHSPIREIWDLYEYTKKHTVPPLARPAFALWAKYNRHLNKRYATQADNIVCNSLNTQKRIKKYLDHDAMVIHPPIDTEKFYYQTNGNFWLSVNRLLPHKRIEVQLEAFRQMPDKKLIIVGSYEKARHFKKYADYVKRIMPPNVEIKSWVDDGELKELYANCRGLIATAQDEDFGMTVVEAMAAGKPVIASNEGGYKETVINGQTGTLIDNINSEKLTQAIQTMDEPEKYQGACQNQAIKFSIDNFITQIKAKINE